MFKFIFSIVIIILSGVQLRAQALDSLKVYELQPVEFSQKIGNIDYKIQNYFSKKNWFTASGTWALGMYDSFNNYGVRLPLEKKGKYFFVHKCEFLIRTEDTIDLDKRTYKILLSDKENIKEEIQLKVKSIELSDSDSERFKSYYLVKVTFEPQEITYESHLIATLITKHYLSKRMPFSPITIVTSKKHHTYSQVDNGLVPITYEKKEHLPTLGGNIVWQTRITYRVYN